MKKSNYISIGEVYGMVMNLEEDNVGAVLLGSQKNINEGDTVKTVNPEECRVLRERAVREICQEVRQISLSRIIILVPIIA